RDASSPAWPRCWTSDACAERCARRSRRSTPPTCVRRIAAWNPDARSASCRWRAGRRAPAGTTPRQHRSAWPERRAPSGCGDNPAMILPPLLALRLSKLLAGVFLYGLAMSLMVRAGLGVAPWDVLTLGLVRQTGLSFGLLTILIGLAVLLLWWPLRQPAGLGTVLNALLVGPSAQFGLWLLPEFDIRWQQVLVFAGGLLLLALATGLYIGARF